MTTILIKIYRYELFSAVLTWFNDFASRVLHNNLPSVQVFEHELEAAQCLHQPELVVHEQVVAFSLERLEKSEKRRVYANRMSV